MMVTEIGKNKHTKTKVLICPHCGYKLRAHYKAVLIFCGKCKNRKPKTR